MSTGDFQGYFLSLSLTSILSASWPLRDEERRVGVGSEATLVFPSQTGKATGSAGTLGHPPMVITIMVQLPLSLTLTPIAQQTGVPL